MAIPTYVLAFVALGLFEFSGPIQTFMRAWSPAGIDRLPDIRSAPGVIVVMSLALYPYVYLLARNAFKTQGQRSLEAARSLGLGPVRAFFRVVLPMARPWIIAGLSMVLMETLADFGAVSIFNFDTFTTAIYKTWYGFFSLEGAAQLSGLLVIIVFCFLAVEQWLRARMRFTSAGRLDGPPAAITLTGWQKWAAAILAWSVFSISFAVPLGQLLIWSIPVLVEAFDPRFFGYVGNTLGLSAGATLIIVGIAVLLTYVRRRHDDRVTWFLARSATLGYALPGTVLAVGVVMVIATLDNSIVGWVRQWTGVGLTPIFQGSIATVIFAYAVRFMAAGLNPVESAMQRITPSLDEAAAGMGVTGWRLLGRVHLPMLKSGVLTAAVLVCVDVLKEMPITLMTRPFGWDTLAVKIFEFTSEGEWQLAALPAVFLVVAGLAPIILLTRRS
jgi:iron(III) transport system permease protein